MLNTDLVNIYCPACDQQNDESLMKKVRHTRSNDGEMVVACLKRNHTYDYRRLLELKPRMPPMVIQEKQPTNTINHTVWIYPEVLSVLQRRYPQNFMTTICAALTALADPDTLLIEGEHARTLRDSGVAKGRNILQIAEENKLLQQRLAEAETRMKVLEPFFAAFGAKMPALGESPSDINATVEPASTAPGFKFHIPRPQGM